MRLVETISYLTETLFSITFSHSGFDNLSETTVSELVKIKPDNDTTSLLGDYNIDCTFTNDIFVSYIRAKLVAPPALQPRAAYVMPRPADRFRFLLIAGVRFMNTTVVEPVSSGRYYYFTNRNNAASGMFITHDAGAVNQNDLTNVADVEIRERPLAVIDIFSSGAINNNYELFTGNAGQLRRPNYRVLFRSRI
jgi:hypothetical protein